MTIAISSIGTAVPQYHQQQSKVVAQISDKLNLNPAEERRLKKVYDATGIETRHSVLEDFTKLDKNSSFFQTNATDEVPGTLQRMHVYNKSALELAAIAIQNCCAHSNFDLHTITHLITVSCTGMSAPGLDIAIIKQFTLPTTIHRTTINFMGCYGAISGLKMAHAICKGDSQAIVLLINVELCTLHLQGHATLDHLIAGSLFADGASAAIIQSNPKTKKSLKIKDFYCDLVPQSTQEMTWEIGAQGFNIGLSSYVPQLIESGIEDFVQKLLTRSSLTLNDMQFFAIHPGSKKILEACEKALQISPEHNRYSYQILRQYGNMSSATILFILQLLLDDVAEADHDSNIFSCAFGPGLTLESVLLQLHCV